MSSESLRPAEQRDLVQAKLEEVLGKCELRYSNRRWQYPEISRGWYLMFQYVSWDLLRPSAAVGLGEMASFCELFQISFADILAAEDVGALLRQRVAEHDILQAE